MINNLINTGCRISTPYNVIYSNIQPDFIGVILGNQDEIRTVTLS